MIRWEQRIDEDGKVDETTWKGFLGNVDICELMKIDTESSRMANAPVGWYRVIIFISSKSIYFDKMRTIEEMKSIIQDVVDSWILDAGLQMKD